jgi:protein-L-isoaspartate(D-aspartate) O-methyltransferase
MISSVPQDRMVARLREAGIRDEKVLEVMAKVPRHTFVPSGLRAEAYRERSLPIGEKQTISNPLVVARMTELLQARRGHRVLEIGTGSGYQTAVLAELELQVYSIERIASLARRAAALLRDQGYLNVHIKNFDGTYGWSEWAPYHGILVSAAARGVPPPPLLEQLGEGGRLVIPVEQAGAQRLVVYRKSQGRTVASDQGPANFVPLVGRFAHEKGTRS